MINCNKKTTAEKIRDEMKRCNDRIMKLSDEYNELTKSNFDRLQDCITSLTNLSEKDEDLRYFVYTLHYEKEDEQILICKTSFKNARIITVALDKCIELCNTEYGLNYLVSHTVVDFLNIIDFNPYCKY